MRKKSTPLTDEERERAKLLHASGKSPNYIATGMGRSHHTLQRFLSKPETREQVQIQREELAGMFDQVAHGIVSRVTDEDVTKANLVQKMTSAGIAIDKAAMLRGETPMALNMVAIIDVLRLMRDQRNGAAPADVEINA